MKKKLVFCALVLALAAVTAVVYAQSAPNTGQVSYYKQTGVVDQNRNRTNGDNTGQFIAFTKAGCYDSDNKGYDAGNGFLEYKGLENNIHVYYGKTFWGQGSYFFNSDFSRLNIRTDAGITYVYEKTGVPSGVVTSAKIYRKPEPAANTPAATMPSAPAMNFPPAPGVGTGGTDRIQCKNCYGTGNCNICKGNYKQPCKNCDGLGKKVVGYGTNARYETCPVCRGMTYTLCVAFGYTCQSGKCSQCAGKGWIYL
jgi:hypothetical protein